MIGWWVAWVGITTLSVVLLTSLLLPATRTGGHELVLKADPDLVRQALLDVEAQPRWRRDIEAVVLGSDGRTWIERTRKGERIRFEVQGSSGEPTRAALRELPGLQRAVARRMATCP
jgi:hypothetical protein